MKFIDGGLSVDDRGVVTFVNDFDFKDVKRFYMVQNHSKGFVRAWHGHKKEAKYVLVVRGTVVVRTTPINFKEGDAIQEFVLSDKKPRILFIPAGNYNGFQTLTDNAQVMFFSTTTLEESEGDDYREKWDKFDKWEVEQR